jgi:hypothetical protein
MTVGPRATPKGHRFTDKDVPFHKARMKRLMDAGRPMSMTPEMAKELEAKGFEAGVHFVVRHREPGSYT